MRLERVPGGLRLAEWAGERAAPARAGARRGRPVGAAGRAPRRRACSARASWRASPRAAGDAVSRGRSGELREELRVEALDGDRVRIGRWLYRPGTGEWELQEAPPMLPAARYAEALAGMSAPPVA